MKFNFLKKTLRMIFLVQFFCLSFVFLAPVGAYAATPYKPLVEIPSSKLFNKDGNGVTIDGSSIAEYIKSWYTFAIAAIGILVVVMIMGGGLLWLTAGGNQSQISSAREWIMGAFAGLLIALLSYTALDILNPNLVNFRPLNITEVLPKDFDIGGPCCDIKTGFSYPANKKKECTDSRVPCPEGTSCVKKLGCKSEDSITKVCCRIVNYKWVVFGVAGGFDTTCFYEEKTLCNAEYHKITKISSKEVEYYPMPTYALTKSCYELSANCPNVPFK